MLRFSVFVAGSLYGVTTESWKVQGIYDRASILGVPSVTVEVIA